MEDNIKELERKAKKATRWKGKIWTVEEIEFARAKAKIWADIFYYGSHETLIKVLKQLYYKKLNI